MGRKPRLYLELGYYRKIPIIAEREW